MGDLLIVLWRLERRGRLRDVPIVHCFELELPPDHRAGERLDVQDYAAAEPLLLTYHAELAKGRSDLKPQLTSDAARALVQLYEAWGKPEAAANWRAQLPSK